MFTKLITQSFAAALGVELEDLNQLVISQSVAIPIKATFLVFGHPEESPMVDFRLTPPVLPVVPPVSDWRLLRPSNELTDMAPHFPLRLSTPPGKMELDKSALYSRLSVSQPGEPGRDRLSSLCL